MTFNIGSQNAGVVNNVAGDQTVHGGQHAYAVPPPEVMAAIQAVRASLTNLPLDPSQATRLDADLADLDRRLATGQTTKRDTAERLSRLLATIQRTGTVITSTSSIGAAITTIGHWLGPLGAALIHLLA